MSAADSGTSPARRSALAAVALAALALPVQVVAQAGHPLPQLETPIHARVSRSDAVVLARVDRVEPGRLQLQNLGTLVGEIPEHFGVKTWPGAAPGYGAGDFAVLFLLGARSPYVLLGEPRDQLPPSDEVRARSLAAGIEALAEAGDDPERLLELHVGWLEGDDELLARLALVGFLDREGPLRSPPPGFARERARLALDSSAPLPARRASLILASRDPSLMPSLIEWVPGDGGPADAELSALVLNQAVMMRTQGTEVAVVRLLRESDPKLRRLGLGAARRLRRDLGNEALEQIEALAARDPDPDLRRLAQRVLDAHRQAR